MKVFSLIILAISSFILSVIPVSAQVYQSTTLIPDLSSLAANLMPTPLRVSIGIGIAVACMAWIFFNSEDLSFRDAASDLKGIFLDFGFKKQIIPLIGNAANIINLGVFLGLNIYLTWNAITPFKLGTQAGRVAFKCFNDQKISCWIDQGRTLQLFAATALLYVITRVIIEYITTQSRMFEFLQRCEEKNNTGVNSLRNLRD